MRWAAAETRSALPVAAVADLRLAGTVACAALGVLFCLLGGGFFLAGPKAALFVSGFGTLPPSERARYDTAALEPGLCPAVSGLGVLFLAGAGASALWSGWARCRHWQSGRCCSGGRCAGTPSGHLNDMI